MKKILVLIFCLIFILVGCNSDKKANKSIQATNEQNSVDEKKETDLNNANSIQSTKINPSKQLVKDKNNVSQKISKVNKKIELYEGNYLDDRYFAGDLGESTKKYCEVVISNVTNASFDFTVYEVDRETEDKKVIFLTNTSVFTGDGTKASFYGNDYTLNFTFPYVTVIQISGFKALEGNTYLNNKIPKRE